MNTNPPDYLTTSDVVYLASIIGVEDGVFIVGGQSLNLWAERYSDRFPELDAYGPFTSKDIDYFGHRQAAAKLANALDGELLCPSMDDATPNTAVVRATINGRLVVIDFIASVLGIMHVDHLKRHAVQITARMRGVDGSHHGSIAIPVMHPVHCMISRIANVLSPATRRQDDNAMRQLAASRWVVYGYLQEMLESSEIRAATDVVQDLYDYIRSDQFGRTAHEHVAFDPLDIIRSVAHDTRFDQRFRAITIAKMIRDTEQRRTRRAKDRARRQTERRA